MRKKTLMISVKLYIINLIYIYMYIDGLVGGLVGRENVFLQSKNGDSVINNRKEELEQTGHQGYSSVVIWYVFGSFLVGVCGNGRVIGRINRSCEDERCVLLSSQPGRIYLESSS